MTPEEAKSLLQSWATAEQERLAESEPVAATKWHRAHEAALQVLERLAELEERGTPEICICAAIRLQDGRIFRGNRHYDCLRTVKAQLEPNAMRSTLDKHQQGFMTSRNRYVGRDEALALQKAAGIPSAYADGYRSQLYSEDLY